MLVRPLLAAGLVLAVATPALAAAHGPTRREQQLAACADDMERLCPGPMSESKKLKTCIRPRKAQVSQKCRAWLEVPE